MEESLGARRKTIAECLVLNPLLPPRSVSEVESSDACCDFVILLLRKLWLTSPVVQNELSDSLPPPAPFLLDEKVYYTPAFFPSR